MSEVIATVNGLDIKEKTLYKVIDKADNSALQGLKEYGSTKIPQEFMGTSFQCPYNRATGTHDTGFYIHSPCYNGLDTETRIKLVNRINEKLVEPYERVYGLEKLDNKNEEFWNNYNIDLEEGRIFNTANIKDLLDLYLAMLAFELTPKDLKGDPRFASSQFMVEDRDVTTKKKDERAQNYMNALQQFFIMLTTEKHKLISVLKFANMNGADSMNSETSDSTLNSLFKDWIEANVSNIDNFLRVSKLVNTKTGLSEVTLYSLVLDMNKRNKLPKIGEEFTYDDYPLGADLKTVAKNLATKTSLKELRGKILQEQTD